MRLALEVLPFGVKCMEDLLDKITIGCRFLTHITLAATVYLEARCQFPVIERPIGVLTKPGHELSAAAQVLFDIFRDEAGKGRFPALL